MTVPNKYTATAGWTVNQICGARKEKSCTTPAWCSFSGPFWNLATSIQPQCCCVLTEFYVISATYISCVLKLISNSDQVLTANLWCCSSSGCPQYAQLLRAPFSYYEDHRKASKNILVWYVLSDDHRTWHIPLKARSSWIRDAMNYITLTTYFVYRCSCLAQSQLTSPAWYACYSANLLVLFTWHSKSCHTFPSMHCFSKQSWYCQWIVYHTVAMLMSCSWLFLEEQPLELFNKYA